MCHYFIDIFIWDNVKFSKKKLNAGKDNDGGTGVVMKEMGSHQTVWFNRQQETAVASQLDSKEVRPSQMDSQWEI